jgi:opacity protein-like surface antigen
VALGYGFGNREVSADAWDSESSVQIINLDGIGSSGPLGAVTLGGDYDTGSVILRARVDYAISGAESTLNILGNRVATVEKGDEVIAWAGAGLPISADRRTVVYGLAGWASSEFTLKTDDGKASKDYAGLAVALGVEHAFSDMFSASAETQYIDWGKETIARGEGFAAHDDPEEFRVMLGAKVRLKP